MAAAESIPIAYVPIYNAEIHRLAAQKQSKLRSSVRVYSGLVGKNKNVNRFGASELAPITGRHSATVILNPVHSLRRMTPTDKGGAFLLDKQDEWKILIQPENDYARNHAESANRFYDRLIITALAADSVAVDENDATSAVTLASWKSGINSYGANSAMTMAKVAKARRRLSEDEKIDGYFTAVVSPQAIEQLFLEVETGMAANRFTSKDYTDMNSLRMGTVPDGAELFGFHWIVSNLLPVDASLDRSCYFFEKESMALGVWQDIYTSLSIRYDLNDARQVYAAVSGGSTRVEEAGVVEVKFREVASS